MSEAPAIGIDLGTTFSAVAAIDRHGMPRVLSNGLGKRTTPSVVYFEGLGETVVGEIARNQALADPGRTVQFIKRHMGDSSYRLNIDGKEYLPETISALILKTLRADAEAGLGMEIKDAVITVPAYFKDSQREATRVAGEIADLNVVAMINEPTAAAVAYGLIRDEGHRTVLVYDFGGGTFDVTILKVDGLELTVLATDGISELGGIDLDEQLADHLAEQFFAHHGIDLREQPDTRLDLLQRAESAKVDLSVRQSVKVTLSSGPAAMRIDLDRDTFDRLVAAQLTRTEQCMNRTLAAAGLGWHAIDTVLPVGGSSRIASVKELIERVTGKQAARDVNPDECVVLGAAMRAGLELRETRASDDTADPGMERPETGIVINDVAPHSLGVRAMNTEGRPVNSIVIPRFMQLPCERKREYRTRADDQTAIEIEVLQGEDPDPFSVDVESVGRMRVDGLPPRRAGQVIIMVSLRYDGDGVVEVAAEELEGHRVVREQLLRKGAELDDDAVDAARARVATLTTPSPDSPEDAAARDEVAGDASSSHPEQAGETRGPDSQPAPEPAVANGAETREDTDRGETDSAGDDLYTLLGLSTRATRQEIEARIATLRSELSEAADQSAAGDHAVALSPESARGRLKEIEDAEAILLDPATRADYDDSLSRRTSAPAADTTDRGGEETG
jgi:molecular chaperone DnaK